MKIIYCNYYFDVYHKVCGFEYSVQIFDIIGLGNIGGHAKSSEVVSYMGEEKSDWSRLTNSSVCQSPRKEKMGQRKEERGAEQTALPENEVECEQEIRKG